MAVAHFPTVGVRYPSERNADGSYTVRGVPIFAETEKRLGTKVVAFEKAWLEEAVANANRRAKNGYLAPLKIRHIGSIPAPTFAGKVWPNAVRRSVVDGEAVWTVFADYVEVPPGIFGLMVRGELPYVSIEAFNYEERLIDAVALLDADTPHIPFPLFRAMDPGADSTAAFSKAFTADVNPAEVPGTGTVVASFASGEHRAVLSRFNAMADPDDPKAKKTDDDGEGTPAGAPPKKPAAEGGEGGEPKGAQAGKASVDGLVTAIFASAEFRQLVAGHVAAMFASLATGEAGDGKNGSETPNGQPAEQPKGKEDGVTMSKEVAEQLAKFQGEIDGLKSLEAKRKSDQAALDAVDATIARLARFGKGTEHRQELLAIATGPGGLAALKVYEDAVRAHGTEAPPTPAAFAAAVDPANAPDLAKEVLAYSADRARLATAITCAKDYDQLRAMGHLGNVTLEQHLAANVGPV